MNKRKLHHYWTKFRVIKTWQLVALLLLFTALSVYGLRQNSLGLEPKIQAVVVADRENKNIEAAINELGAYVTQRMNADLPRPIQLEYSYQRAVDIAFDRALEELRSGSLLEEAREVCAELGVIVAAGPQCIQDYLDKNWNPERGSLVVDLPDTALFTHNFAAPSWSPDLPGWSIIATVVLTIAIIGRLIAGVVVRNILKNHH